MTAARPRIRHARRVLGYGALVLLILFGTGVGVANQLLPLVERHPERIAAWLGARVGQPVNFDRAHAEWTRRGPRFTLEGLRVGKPGEVLHIGHADLLVAMYSGMLPGRPLTELKIRDLGLALEQGDDRRWRLVGLPGEQQPDPLETLEGFGELQIEKARLAVRAPRYKLDVVLPRVDLRLRVGEADLQAGAAIWSRLDRAPMRVAAKLGRADYSGTVWAGGENLVLADWSPLLAATGVQVRDGAGTLGAWAQTAGGRVDRLTLEADMQDVRLVSRDALERVQGPARPVSAEFGRVQATARWDLRGDRWQLQAPRLRFTRDGKDASLDGLRMDGGKAVRLGARSLDLAPLASLLALSPKLPPALRAWLDASQPRAVLHDVALERDRDGTVRGQLRVSDLAIDPMGTTPGVSGLGAALTFDGAGGIARIGSAPVVFDWPKGFGDPLDVRVAGSVGWWRDGAGWQVGSSGLRIAGDGFATDVRARMDFEGDGSKPRLDLAADLGTADFATAKRFWVRHKMPPSSIKWLDTALVSGRIEKGRVVFAGDLDDWPFRNGEGVFDARANIRDATVRFSPDWPAAQHLDLDVAFDGPGFSLAGAGELAGNRVTRVVGGIADFHLPLLTLAIDADGRAEKLRELLVASPLNKEYGEHLRAVSAHGEAKVAMTLALPLQATAGTKVIEGDVVLHDAALADSRWDVAFEHVDGAAHFSDRGFAAKDLAVQFGGRPAVFGLLVGAPFTGDARLAGHASLRGRLPAEALLQRYAALDWLGPYLQGESDWDVQVRIPAAVPGRASPPSQLRLATDLRGIAITLPAPMAKPAATALPLVLDAPLPVEQGEVTLALGDVLRLRAILREKAPMRASLQLGGAAAPAPPAQGMVVRGTAERVDAAGWIAFSAGGGDDDADSPVREVDVQAHELLFADHVFPDTHLRLEGGTASTRLALNGASLQGTIDIPDDPARAIQGQFARMWWSSGAKPATADAAAAPAAVPAPTTAPAPTLPDTAAVLPLPGSPALVTTAPPIAATTAADTDPARVPALRFTIEDLRMGQAQLGRAELATSRMANGMRVERFQTRHKSLSVDAAGEWVRAQGGSRSNLRIDFKADSLGQMLDALGFKGMVDEGRTTATLAGSWPGSPGNFSLSRLAGTLHADIGEGRLLDVEPGGSGRILGLISLAEIPRRMTLDFSDFFAKGFAFNKATGDFTFNEGIARTDNLHINGPSAEIRVNGSADFRRETYDQRVEVLPKAAGVLPAVGLLAAGPVGAAVGVVAQAVLNKPLKQTTRVVYRVTGPWKEPKVEVVERGAAKNAPATEPPAPAPGANP